LFSALCWREYGIVCPHGVEYCGFVKKNGTERSLLLFEISESKRIERCGRRYDGGWNVAIAVSIAAGEKVEETNRNGTRVGFYVGDTKIKGTGGVIAGVGIVSTFAGVPLWIIGSTKKKNTRRTYLREFGDVQTESASPSPYLQLNRSSHSIILALVF
jgi:hypothetical protein